MKKWDCFIIVLFVILCVLAFWLKKSKDVKEKAAIRQMDAKELHYDANDWFIMIDKSEGLVGVYYGTKPIQHIWTDVDIDEGVFPVLIYSEE